MYFLDSTWAQLKPAMRQPSPVPPGSPVKHASEFKRAWLAGGPFCLTSYCTEEWQHRQAMWDDQTKHQRHTVHHAARSEKEQTGCSHCAAGSGGQQSRPAEQVGEATLPNVRQLARPEQQPPAGHRQLLPCLLPPACVAALSLAWEPCNMQCK